MPFKNVASACARVCACRFAAVPGCPSQTASLNTSNVAFDISSSLASGPRPPARSSTNLLGTLLCNAGTCNGTATAITGSCDARHVRAARLLLAHFSQNKSRFDMRVLCLHNVSYADSSGGSPALGERPEIHLCHGRRG